MATSQGSDVHSLVSIYDLVQDLMQFAEVLHLSVDRLQLQPHNDQPFDDIEESTQAIAEACQKFLERARPPLSPHRCNC